MSLNKTIVNGRLPRFDGHYTAGDGNGKKSFMSYAVSVKRDFKKEGEKYYPEDLIPFKAYGPKADFINKFFGQGDGIIITGRLQKDDDYTDGNGVEKKGQLFLLVEDVHFAEGSSSEGNSNGGSAPSAAPSRPAAPGGAPRPTAPAGAAPRPVGGAPRPAGGPPKGTPFKRP